jgi:signal transduction histidine kinase
MKRFGIHSRLLVTAFLVISLTAFALGTLGVKMFHDFAQGRFVDRFEFLARYLALNSELGILIDQRTMLAQLAENLLAEADVAQVQILNNAGDVLAEAAKTLPRPHGIAEAMVRLKASSEESQAFAWSFSAALNGASPDVIGKVRIVYSTSQINRLLRTLTVRYLWLTAGLAGLCLVIFYFISRSLVAPLTRLAHTARKVGEGELQRRMTPGNIPETREVSMAFNAMLDSLERGRRAVEEAHQEMARQNLLAEMGKFSMMIAHEIKNPLGIIKSSFDLLKKDPQDPGNKILVAYIDEEILRINGLIEDFLSFAKPSKPSFRVVDANSMLQDCVERFGRMDAAREIAFKGNVPDISCLSYVDPDLLRRAIDNILKNAVEACEGHGTVFVDAVCGEDTWRVEISDDGCGIQEDMMEKIFSPFITTRTKGTGLGLAYISQVIQAHNGSIGVKNRKAKGACFTIEIPREPKMIDLFEPDDIRK